MDREPNCRFCETSLISGKKIITVPKKVKGQNFCAFEKLVIHCKILSLLPRGTFDVLPVIKIVIFKP